MAEEGIYEPGLSIIILAHNEFENTVKCVESIRMCADVEPLDVILADNYSDDGLAEWALAQTDFTYVRFEEGFLPYGSVLNQIFEGLPLREHVLVMSSRLMITDSCLSSMVQTLVSHPDTGLVSGMSNGAFSKLQTLSFARHKQSEDASDFRVYGSEEDALLFHRTLIDETGPFPDSMTLLTSIAKDLSLRLIRDRKRCMVCAGAFLFAWREPMKEPVNVMEKLGDDNAILELIWGVHYVQLTGNEFIVNLMDAEPDAAPEVLEVGCEIGGTLFRIGEKFPHAVVHGCDISEAPVKIAACSMDAFVGNIEDENLPFAENSLDYVIFGDVLEHLHNPLRTVTYIRTLLKENGCILASIPNVMNIEVMRGLLHGDFTYTEIGLLDKTHIHLFTYKEILRMFEKAGFTVEKTEQYKSDISEQDAELIEKLCALDSAAEPFMYETFQYIVRARKNPDA